MINAQFLELPLSLTCFDGSKGVPAIDALLYLEKEESQTATFKIQVRTLRLIPRK